MLLLLIDHGKQHNWTWQLSCIRRWCPVVLGWMCSSGNKTKRISYSPGLSTTVSTAIAPTVKSTCSRSSKLRRRTARRTARSRLWFGWEKGLWRCMDPWTRIKQEEISWQRELKQTFTAASVKKNGGGVFRRSISGGQGSSFVENEKKVAGRYLYQGFGQQKDYESKQNRRYSRKQLA